MTHSHQMTDVGQIKTFVRGGNARFTLVSNATGNRITYRTRSSKDGKVHFVKVLTGADNTNSYTFLGTIFSDGTYRHGFQSPIGHDAMSAKAFAWFFDRVADGDVTGVQFWHEGRCGRCGRVLTVPESIATGFGPECAGRVGAELPMDFDGTHQAPESHDETETFSDPEEEEFTRQIQHREQEEEIVRMNHKFGLPTGYRPPGWMPR